jgi:ribosomal protein S18 acetylase RimI-like enzyme
VHRLTQLAFRDYDKLDPPSGAPRESEDSVRADLDRGGGALAWMGTECVGCLRFQIDGDYLHVRRVAVDPAWQRRGIGKSLMAWAHAYAHELGLAEVRIGVRPQLTGNIRFYKGLEYRVVAEHRHPGYNRTTWIEMARAV